MVNGKWLLATIKCNRVDKLAHTIDIMRRSLKK